MELFQGCQTKTEQDRVERALKDYDVVWPTEESCNQAMSVFARYRLSHNLGILDALIGQLAVSLSSALYTFNEKHYAVIPDLETVQPYSKS